MYGIYANIEGILMVNVTIYGIHGSYVASLTIITHTKPMIETTKHSTSWEPVEPVLRPYAALRPR